MSNHPGEVYDLCEMRVQESGSLQRRNGTHARKTEGCSSQSTGLSDPEDICLFGLRLRGFNSAQT